MIRGYYATEIFGVKEVAKEVSVNSQRPLSLNFLRPVLYGTIMRGNLGRVTTICSHSGVNPSRPGGESDNRSQDSLNHIGATFERFSLVLPRAQQSNRVWVGRKSLSGS